MTYYLSFWGYYDWDEWNEVWVGCKIVDGISAKEKVEKFVLEYPHLKRLTYYDGGTPYDGVMTTKKYELLDEHYPVSEDHFNFAKKLLKDRFYDMEKLVNECE